MSSNSVFPEGHEPTREELKAMGRETLQRLWTEAARRLDNQRRVYGSDYRPGRQGFLEWSLRFDMEKIEAALRDLQDAERPPETET